MQDVVLKGALLLKTIGIPRARPTMNIDMLCKGKADQASLIAPGEVVVDLKIFAMPLLRSLARGETVTEQWGWVSS